MANIRYVFSVIVHTGAKKGRRFYTIMIFPHQREALEVESRFERLGVHNEVGDVRHVCVVSTNP